LPAAPVAPAAPRSAPARIVAGTHEGIEVIRGGRAETVAY
jgi:hypothetical protein